MRYRNVKNAYEKIDSHIKVIKNPQTYKGRWKEVFGNDNPIHIEIGMGKGQFIFQKALKNKEINFIGIEKYTAILAKAIEYLDMEEKSVPANLLVIREDAEMLEEIFDRSEVERLYLNFSDPWPKDKHVKRRLTYRTFLEKYKRVLKPNSSIILKTDNELLFSFSAQEMQECGFIIKELCDDLHNSTLNQDNIMTEYEEKFALQGMKIHLLEAINQKQ